MPQSSPALRRLHLQLAQAEETAREILREAQLDVEKLEAMDIEYTSRLPFSGHPPVVILPNHNIENSHLLIDPTNPIHYAFMTLRWVRLTRRALERQHALPAEQLAWNIYSFQLGIQFRKAEFGMQFPAVTRAFHTRHQKQVASKERPHPLKSTIEAIYSQLKQSGSRATWKQVDRELRKQGHSIQGKTLRNLLTGIRKNHKQKKNSR